MAYTPTTMQKIQASQTSPTSTTSASRVESSAEKFYENNSENMSTNVTSSNIPMYQQSYGTVQESPPLAIHSDTQYQVGQVVLLQADFNLMNLPQNDGFQKGEGNDFERKDLTPLYKFFSTLISLKINKSEPLP